MTDSTSQIYGATVTVPEGALSTSTTITINEVENCPSLSSGDALCVDFGPDGTTFSSPVAITIPYNDDGITDENSLRIFYYNETTASWEEIGVSNIDTENNIITLEVTHFSIYAAGPSESATWTISTLESSDTGAFFPRTQALDSSGNIHVDYRKSFTATEGSYSYTDYSLKYITNSSGSWVDTEIDIIGDAEHSMAVDPSGDAHIVYHDGADGCEDSLMYATNGSGSWYKTIIEANRCYTVSPSLTADSSGYLYLVNMEATDLANWEGDYWEDPDYTGYDLVHRTTKATSLVNDPIDATGAWGYSYLGGDSSCNWGDSGPLYFPFSHELGGMFYLDQDGNDVSVDGFWGEGTADGQYYSGLTKVHDFSDSSGACTNEYLFEHFDFTMSENGSTFSGRIQWSWECWHDDPPGDPDTCSGVEQIEGWRAWVAEFMEYPVAVYDTDIVTDVDGNVHVAYFASDDTFVGLKYATNASGSWVISPLTVTDFSVPQANGATFTDGLSMAIDSNGAIHVAYSHWYATNASGSWVATELGVNRRYQPSIAVDSDGKVHISGAEDTGNSRVLTYTTNATGSWVTSTIDETVYFTSTSLLSLDPTGSVAYVTYSDHYYDAVEGIAGGIVGGVLKHATINLSDLYTN